MSHRAPLVFFLVFILGSLLFFKFNFTEDPSDPQFFVGVDAVSGNVTKIKKLVDEVKSYTNLFVIGSTEITNNLTKVNEVCQYIYNSGLYFMIFAHPTENFNQCRWFEESRSKWGDRFLGLYAYDEAGGHQIDRTPFMLVKEADNYTDAAEKFVGKLDEHLKSFKDCYIPTGELSLLTADYGLYWFDYEAGYDVVLCEFGWNHSRLLSIALNRGAAEMHGKDWGAIITWTHRKPPYIESADELYYDMLLAYLSGAKYVVVFNRPMSSYQGILTDEHLDAMKRFWRYIHENPQRLEKTEHRTAYVLPKDYGWGFRGGEDKVWGLWVDDLSIEIGTDLNYLLHTHHLSLDIIYDHQKYYSNIQRYSELIFWNGTVKD